MTSRRRLWVDREFVLEPHWALAGWSCSRLADSCGGMDLCHLPQKKWLAVLGQLAEPCS